MRIYAFFIDNVLNTIRKSKHLSQALKKCEPSCPIPFGAISKQLKVPQASIQTIVCRYKNLRATETRNVKEGGTLYAK